MPPPKSAIDLWTTELQDLAKSRALAAAIQNSFGQAEAPSGLNQIIQALAQGDTSALPAIVTLDSVSMPGMVGAYSAQTRTIYLNDQVAEHAPSAREALAHELGHFIGNEFFSDRADERDVVDFIYSLLGQNHSLMLSAAAHEPESHQALVTLPDSGQTVAVQAFKTDLHISWMQKQLPMLNANAFNLIARAQDDTDAFLGAFDLDGLFGEKYSPYGLQFHNPSHFDNNNVRGGVESVRKRWEHGIDNLSADSVTNSLNQPLADLNYVGRNFTGQYVGHAGVENLLYRFGQISHAMQDFYSHSNWVELSRTERKWIPENALLDSALGIPKQLNPGDMLPNAPGVMVAMSGLNFSTLVNQVGSSTFVRPSNYFAWPEKVYWWVVTDQKNWGEVTSTGAAGTPLQGNTVAALMTGAVNEAIYYSTDYSVPLRAAGRSGFFETEYFRGFSHGGGAGAFVGQWVRPLSKDTEDNGRFTDKAATAQVYQDAQTLADLQVRHDWDRLGNLIFDKHGVAGLQRFANFALIEDERARFVSTYSTSGARWDWSTPTLVPTFALLSVASSAHFASDHEGELRQVKVFFDRPANGFVSVDNVEYLTQYKQGDSWLDSKVGVIGLHHDDVETADLLSPRADQHANRGGRALWSEQAAESDHHLVSLFVVENINTQVRVFINDFDVSIDELRIVNAAGGLIANIDIDRANFEETRRTLLEQYNILVNARPEPQALTAEVVVPKTIGSSAVLLSAAQFFDDSDLTHSIVHNANSSPVSLRFVSHDATLPWLKLRSDGLLEISDVSQVASGNYTVYVAVSDGASQFENMPIVLSIDPGLTIQSTRISSASTASLTFVNEAPDAVTIFSCVFDASGRATSELHQLATRLGQAYGTPDGLSANTTVSVLSDPADNGTLRFFALYPTGNRLISLDTVATGADRFMLKSGSESLAELRVNVDPGTPSYVNELLIPGLDEMMLGIPLNVSVDRVDSSNDANPHRVRIETTLHREAMHESEFGLFLVDLRTGDVVDPRDGTLTENLLLGLDNIDRYSVFSASAPRSGPVQRTADFLLDKDLDPDNLALLPYLKVDAAGTKSLYFSSASSSPDGISHIAKLNQSGFACEDLVGSDYDFDDLAVIIRSVSLTDYY